VQSNNQDEESNFISDQDKNREDEESNLTSLVTRIKIEKMMIHSISET
jgi:hypothetical protein